MELKYDTNLVTVENVKYCIKSSALLVYMSVQSLRNHIIKVISGILQPGGTTVNFAVGQHILYIKEPLVYARDRHSYLLPKGTLFLKEDMFTLYVNTPLFLRAFQMYFGVVTED